MCELEEKIKQLFDEVNENTHPLGTKSWLYHWNQTKKIVLALLDEWQKQLQDKYVEAWQIHAMVDTKCTDQKQKFIALSDLGVVEAENKDVATTRA